MHPSSAYTKTVRRSAIEKTSVASRLASWPIRRHTWLSGNPLEPLLPLLVRKPQQGTRLMAVPNGNNARDWAIRRRLPTFDRTINMAAFQRSQRCAASIKAPSGRDVVRYDPSPLGNLGVQRQQLSITYKQKMNVLFPFSSYKRLHIVPKQRIFLLLKLEEQELRIVVVTTKVLYVFHVS